MDKIVHCQTIDQEFDLESVSYEIQIKDESDTEMQE